MPLVHEYQIESLLEICEDVLIKADSEKKEANLYFLYLADRFELTKLQKQCIETAKSKDISQLIEQKYYKYISRGSIVQILEYQAKRLENALHTSVTGRINYGDRRSRWPDVPAGVPY